MDYSDAVMEQAIVEYGCNCNNCCAAFLLNRSIEQEYGKALDSGMDNVFAWRLGEIALDAGDPKRKDVGDLIDRGLILRRLLEEKGFLLVTKK